MMRFPDLSKRLLTASVAILLLALILTFAYSAVVKYLVFFLAAILGGVAIWEFAKLAKIESKKGDHFLLIFLSIVLIASFFLSSYLFFSKILPLVVLVIAFFLFFIRRFNQIEGALFSISRNFLALCYIAVPLGLLLKILYFPIAALQAGAARWWVIYLVATTKMTDVGGYFGGILLGKKRLAPILSPNKTVSGAFFGLIAAVCMSLLFFFLTSWIKGFSFTFFQSLWLGGLIGIFGQVGDLAESLLKREAGVKDSNSLPGMGGVLDMLDSLLFTIPILYLFLFL
ncbi:MAG: phosphatidate cytidylyltransferase [Simkania negevensis]|nr:phosphatidate cytidylyltransferase [Simkania negevensis]